MARLADLFEKVAAFTPEAFTALAKNIDEKWLEEALGAVKVKGDATLRKRRLPVLRAIWLVVGMGLFRDRSIHEVVCHLGLALPHGAPNRSVAPSAIPQARQRLGVDPIEKLFSLTAQSWAGDSADSDRWRGLAIYAADGTSVRVPDTVENEVEFGRPKTGRSKSGYPQVRMVALMAARSHILAGYSAGKYTDGELKLADDLWDQVPDHSLIILDRGFVSWWLVHRLQSCGAERHWMIRAKSDMVWRTVKQLGPGDELVEFRPSRQLRRKHREIPEVLTARRVSFQVKGYRPTSVITSLLDAEAFPANEIAEMYHERWEVELGFDEIKTHLLEREEAIRSKTPDGIRQELAGIAIAYNLVRVEMERVANELDVPPTRISFRHSLELIRNFCLGAWSTSPGVLPKRLVALDGDMRLMVLPERRTQRRYPRHVKIKLSNYAKNPGRPALPP